MALGLALTALAAPFGAIGLDALEIAEPAEAASLKVYASCSGDVWSGTFGCEAGVGP